MQLTKPVTVYDFPTAHVMPVRQHHAKYKRSKSLMDQRNTLQCILKVKMLVCFLGGTSISACDNWAVLWDMWDPGWDTLGLLCLWVQSAENSTLLNGSLLSLLPTSNCICFYLVNDTLWQSLRIKNMAGASVSMTPHHCGNLHKYLWFEKESSYKNQLI